MSLPREIWTLVFSHLEANDLLQCQLASKQWHKVSLRPLYANLPGDKVEKVFTYVRTIICSPQLGEYLNTIDFNFLFYYKTNSDEFDKIGLLDTVINYCPNITKIDGFVGDIQFWTRLMYAATQGQLSRLESLPRPYKQYLKSYIDTIFVFKNTITSLWMSDGEFHFRPQMIGLAAYDNLFNQIDQIKNLNTINMECFTDKYLSHFDELIDKCPNLKAFHLELYSVKHIQQPNESGKTILPRPDIQSFGCRWIQINANNQLEYLMHKLPNLRSLRIVLSNGNACSGPTLVRFIQYVISIPDFELQLEVDDEDVPNIITEFTKKTNGCRNITLGYFDHFYTTYRISLCAKKGLSVEFPTYTNDNEPLHLQILSEVGKSIRSIRLNNNPKFPLRKGKQKITIVWLFDVLQLCPLLEELTIGNPTRSLPIHHTLQYPSIKKLTIDGAIYTQWLDFLNSLSLCLPNLSQLSLALKSPNMHAIIIDMPHTSFDLLVWSSQSAYGKEFEVYIKLNTEKGLEYYLGERSMLVPISESRYLLSPKHVRFDISCKHLKELRIKRALPERGFSFVF